MSIAALQTMLLEVEQVFAAVGLTLNLGETTFTSTLACEGKTLELSGHVVKWSPRLTFLGTVITLCGNDDEAIRARMTRALRAFQNWSPLLTNKAIPVVARVAAFLTSVLSSFCWQAQNWTPTKKQYNYIGSWFARLGSSMTRVRRCPEEPMDSWWRRLHRDGKRFWTKHHVDVISVVKVTKFRFAGHVARLPVDRHVHRVLKVRHLAWWKAQQAKIHTTHGPRPHVCRFNALHRWEGPLEAHFGVVTESQPGTLVVWMQTGQNRDDWKAAMTRYLNV